MWFSAGFLFSQKVCSGSTERCQGVSEWGRRSNCCKDTHAETKSEQCLLFVNKCPIYKTSCVLFLRFLMPQTPHERGATSSIILHRKTPTRWFLTKETRSAQFASYFSACRRWWRLGGFTNSPKSFKAS